MSALQPLKGPIVRALRRTNMLAVALQWRRSARRRIGAFRDWRGAPAGLRGALARPGVVAHREGRVWWAAVQRERASMHEAREHNLKLLLGLLDEAGVAYFFVPIRDSRQYRIGVDVRNRDRIVEQLRSHRFVEPTYLRPAGVSAAKLLPLLDVPPSEPHEARLRTSDHWWLWVPLVDPHGRRAIGIEVASHLEFWHPVEVDQPALLEDADQEAEQDDEELPPENRDADAEPEPPQLRASRRNEVASIVETASIAESAVRIGDLRIPAPRDFARYRRSHEVDFPIDLVYTWVDDADPLWRQRRDEALGQGATGGTADGHVSARYRNRNELLYSLRSVAMCVPWARHIYLVTDRQRPSWLDESVPGLTVVDHTEIFRPDDVLPTFNSHAIESRLHRIEGLAEHYIYVNDDVFFARLVEPTTFFTPSGRALFFPSRARVPVGPPRPGEPSVNSATKNGRELLYAAHGAFPVRKMKHTPHPQRRSTVLDIERQYPEAMARVGRNQFRSITDIPTASWLQHYHGEIIGNSQEGPIRYNYINLAADNLPDRLDKLLTGNFDVWCLNDVDVVEDAAEVERVVSEFLERAFPWPSPWERTQPRSAMAGRATRRAPAA